MDRSRKGLIAGGLGAALLCGAAYADGIFSTLPIIGGSSFCDSFVTGTTGQICQHTIPQGPAALTGSELIPADIAGGAGPTQSATIPVSSIAYPFGINRLVGGDFGTNLWQRGTTPVSAATPSTAVIGADRWYAYSSGNTVTVTKQTGAADTIPTLGFYASQRVSRPSGTNNTQICVGQVLDKQAAAPLIGNNAVFSFWALAGAALTTVANNNITANVAYYTAADSATPGTNTGTFSLGTITGYTAAVAGPSAGTTASVAAGVATVPISTTWTRYSVYAPIPAVNAAGTAVTGVGVSLCYTPASGTGGSTEWFEFTGAQLQPQSSTAQPAFASGVTSPTAFERRSVAAEEALQYYYSWGPGVEVNGAHYNVAGNCQVNNTLNLPFQAPIAMRVAPASGGNNVLTAGGYSVKTAAAITAIGTIAVSTSTPQNILMTSNAACTTTVPYTVVGTNTTGVIVFSAEP